MISPRRYEKRRSILLTTNRPFVDWPTTFPNASRVVTLVGRLMHKSEIVTIDGDSYRLREVEERQRERAAASAGAALDSIADLRPAAGRART